MLTALDHWGLVIAIVPGGVLLFAAGVTSCWLAIGPIAAKWDLTPNVAVSQQHLLWGSFVWRNELGLTFVESIALLWMLHLVYETPLLTIWLRTMGAEIGRGV